MSVEPLTREHLDSLICQNPSCPHTDHKELVLNSGCHRTSPQNAAYWADGTLEVRCKICNRFIMSVAVAAEDQVEIDPLTRCGDPECKEPVENHKAFVIPPCHKRGGVRVEYDAGSGLLSFACGSCGKAFPVIDDRGIRVRSRTVTA